jgi:hypothetical protein
MRKVINHPAVSGIARDVPPALLALSSPLPPLSSIPASSSAARRKPVERVAVIGAGIAGLSTIHALGPTPSCGTTNGILPVIECFDGRSGLDQGLGAGIQLNGGLAVLGKINPAVMHAVMEAGMPAKQVRSRSKSWSENATPFETLLELDLAKTIRAAGGGAADELILEDGQLLWYSIMRGTSTNLVRWFEETRDRCRCGWHHVGSVRFSIGCDGVKSAVRNILKR